MDVSSQSGSLDQEILVGLVPPVFQSAHIVCASLPGDPGRLGHFDCFDMIFSSRPEKFSAGIFFFRNYPDGIKKIGHLADMNWRRSTIPSG